MLYPIKYRLTSKDVFIQRTSSLKESPPSFNERSFFHKVFILLKVSLIKGHLPSKVIFHLKQFSVKDSFPSMVVFHQRLSFIRALITMNVFHQSLFFIKFCLPYFFHQQLSSIKGCLPSQVMFHQRSSSIKGCLSSRVMFHQRLIKG